MLTRDRRRFIGQSIWYFLRQDYPHRELIIVDDGVYEVSDVIPSDPRIRYVRLSAPATAGAKRNRACELAGGDVIAHWDDDAWYSSNRLTEQVAQVQGRRARTAALSGVLHYQPSTGGLWRYDPCAGGLAGVHRATLIYDRAHWRANRFREGGRDEIAEFIDASSTTGLDVQPRQDLAVAVLEGSSTGHVNPTDVRWQPRPFSELAELLKFDLSFYAGLGRDRPDAHPLTPAPITLAATFMVYDGYGSMAEYLALGMTRAGADLQVLPLRIDPAAISPEFKELWARSRPDSDGVVLCHAWWGENLARFGHARDLFVKTAWETSRLPADWPARLNKATAVIVPSRFAARVFRESGVQVPVEVVPEGIDPDVYPYLERPEPQGLTTLVVGVLAPRKNFRHAVEAWKRAFADDRNARLILKARFQLERYIADDPRIHVVDSNEATRGILHWYRQADVLLALGNEGFGLPLIEGMATGLPAVALDSEAQGDVCAEQDDIVLPVPPGTWEPVDERPFGQCGVRATPDIDAAARRLRWVAEHRREARELGKRASQWAHARRNVWDLGPATLAVMERHARTSRPLRKTHALWAPTSAASPGYRLYSHDLARHLDRTHVHETPPSVWRSQTLQIEHAPELFDDVALAHQIQAARHAGAAVIVTKHDSRGTAQAWEQPADVLVALDEDAASDLRLRWPMKRVEVIPPGCPAWRAPTPHSRGRAVAVFGAASADGSARAALIEVRSRLGVTMMRFDASIRLSQSGDDLAEQLNREADVVLVLARQAGDMTSTCLTRVALASGVPVVLCGAAAENELPARVVCPEGLVDEIATALDRRRIDWAQQEAARAFCEATAWPRIAALHHALWRTLCN